MTRGFLAVSAALLVATIMLSPAVAYTICSSANPPYTIGSGSPYQYTMGSSGLQVYTIGSGSPYQYTMGSSALQPYTIGSSGLQAYTIGTGSPYQYTMGSSALQPYTIGMGTPAASMGCEVKAPVVVTEDRTIEGETEMAPEDETEMVPEDETEMVPEDETEMAPEDETEMAPEDETEMAPEDETEEPAPVEEPAIMNIVETATAAGNFNVLVGAVEAAGLADVLSGEGPFTVFAPTDDAFAVAEIDVTDTEALIKTLNYHVALGKFMASDLASMPTVATLGGDVTITMTEEGDLMVNGAKIVQEDVICSNGVIQVIDAVLMPPAEETPVEEPPAMDENPVEETPTEEPPVDETSVEPPE